MDICPRREQVVQSQIPRSLGGFGLRCMAQACVVAYIVSQVKASNVVRISNPPDLSLQIGFVSPRSDRSGCLRQKTQWGRGPVQLLFGKSHGLAALESQKQRLGARTGTGFFLGRPLETQDSFGAEAVPVERT